MVIFFSALIVLFAILSAMYVFANDFAHETLEILFPAVGAILLSVYLGFKAIYLDAPPPTTFNVSIAVLHDSEQGLIRGMSPRSIEHIRFNEFRGAHLLDTLLLYNDFKQQDFAAVLRNASLESQSPAQALIRNFIEYALLMWLGNPDVSVGYQPGQTLHLISSIGGGGRVESDLVRSRITGGRNNRNPLLETRPIDVLLPKGSEIVRSDDLPLTFQITTPHTTIAFRYSGESAELLGRPFGKEVRRIYAALNIPDEISTLHMLGVNIEITARQNLVRRYSRQAKAEAIWIERLKEQIQKDFSWEKLRALYVEQ